MNQIDFEAWLENHDCLGDYEGSSPDMETTCAIKIWERSKDIGLEYRSMVSDGDSKAYDQVCEVYGVCEDCKIHNHMDKSSAEYKELKDSEAY